MMQDKDKPKDEKQAELKGKSTSDLRKKYSVERYRWKDHEKLMNALKELYSELY